MDEKIDKAFAVANYMATLSNQRRIILEEFSQKLIHYENGGTFKIDQHLITFVKLMIDLGYTHDVPLIDVNSFPIVIPDVQKFFDDIIQKYMNTLNEYSIKYADLKSKRKIGDMVDL
jgi:hypothetical protein